MSDEREKTVMRGVLASLVGKHGDDDYTSFDSAIKKAQNERTKKLFGFELNAVDKTTKPKPMEKASAALKKMMGTTMAGAALANVPGVQAAVKRAHDAEEAKMRKRIMGDIEKGPKPKPKPRCPFYGFSIMTGVMMPQGGNQCAAMRGRYAPCGMETSDRTPDWTKCTHDIGSLDDVTLVLCGDEQMTLPEWLLGYQGRIDGK